MPRINIEERWWSDPRRLILISKIGLYADAAMLLAIKNSQGHSGQAFDARGLFPDGWAEALLSSNLASGSIENFYVRGSKEHHDWILSRREAGKAGGLKSAQLRQAGAKHHPSTIQASSSSSSSKKEKEYTNASAFDFDSPSGFFREPQLQELYKLYPQDRPADLKKAFRVLKKQIKSHIDFEVFKNAVLAYAKKWDKVYKDRHYIKHFENFCEPNFWKKYSAEKIPDPENVPAIRLPLAGDDDFGPSMGSTR